MGKVSLADKMRIQTLREERLGAKAIMAVKNFSKRLKACVGAGGGHFEHSH